MVFLLKYTATCLGKEFEHTQILQDTGWLTVEWFVVDKCIAQLAEPHPSVHQVAKKNGLHRQTILNLVEGMTRIVAIAAAATG